MLSTGLSTIVVNYSKAKPVFVWFFSSRVSVFCMITLRHAESRAGRAGLRQPDEDEQGPNYCQRVTADDGALGEQHLCDCQDNEKITPTIFTASQKLFYQRLPRALKKRRGQAERPGKGAPSLPGLATLQKPFYFSTLAGVFIDMFTKMI
jgi:hypothetical protein